MIVQWYAIVALTTKSAASKIHFEDILCDEKHLYRIALVHLL